MHRKEVYRTTAQHKRGLSGREVAGALLGSDKSIKSVHKWMFAPNKRITKTKRTVWLCPDCAGIKSNVIEKKEGGEKTPFWVWAVWAIGAVAAFSYFVINGEPTNETSNTGDVGTSLRVSGDMPVHALVCRPTLGTNLRVVDVEPNDVLNVRAFGSARAELVGALAPNSSSAKYAGSTDYLSQDCAEACNAQPQQMTSNQINQILACNASSKIWHLVEIDGGLKGWASGKYLQEMR